jgi:hypothetical protein
MARTTTRFLIVLLLPLLTALALQSSERKTSPFDGMRWKDGKPDVQVEETWYRPTSIHGTAVEDILAYCEKTWPGMRERRFAEDLVEAMEGMGVELPQAVDLGLVRLADGEEVTLEGVPMTRAKRNALRDSRKAPKGSRPSSSLPPERLSRTAALADLEEFRERLEDQFAYLHMKGVDLKGALDDLAGSFEDEVSSVELANGLHRILMMFGDGHARVSSPYTPRPELFPPVLLVEAEGGVVAIRSDRSGLLDERHPFVLGIDGLAIDAWIGALSPWIVDGSPQVVRRRALSALRELVTWREQLGREAQGSVVYELADRPDAKRGKQRKVELGARRPTYGSWPKEESRVLDSQIGYLRIPRMDSDMEPDLRRAMNEFRDTKGLVVDVRGNGGGSRSLLLALAGYLVGPDEEPWVGNVAAFRTSARFGEDHLEARFAYRSDDERWTNAQADVIAEVEREFEPEWEPGADFSEWHYLVLDRTGHPDEYFYDRPVVVLCDSGGFSATDIFLGALELHPRVTLMGSASSGGSARTQGFRLSRSGLEVRCASMASFRPDGRLYDGRGIEVDVDVSPAAGDFLEGGGDRCLEVAVKHLSDRPVR